MSIDYRALCAELLAQALELIDPSPRDGATIIRHQELFDRARAALAQPEPVGPTDEEIMGLMPQQMHDDLATAARAMAEQAGTDSRSITGSLRIILNRHAVDLARAVLARYGRPAITPIPISERLPGAEDCDGEGECWWFHPGDDETGDFWTLYEGGTLFGDTHWLPHWAFPVPWEQRGNASG
jgi:hypothetical protein